MNLIGIRCASFIPKKIVHSDWSLISESWVKISKVNLGIFQILGIPWFPLEYYSLLHLFIRVWDTIPWVYNDTYRSRAQFYHYGVDTSIWFYLWDLLLLKVYSRSNCYIVSGNYTRFCIHGWPCNYQQYCLQKLHVYPICCYTF